MPQPLIPFCPLVNRIVISALVPVVFIKLVVVVCRLERDVAMAHDLFPEVVDTVQCVIVVACPLVEG